MRFPEHWLREWVNPALDTAALADRLTMLGLEVDSAEAAAPPFEGVVIGRVVHAEQHPNADRLRLCTVDDGSGAHLQVVCGAANAVEGLRAPFARIGARLPGGVKVRRTRLRGVESQGMLCSARELGLGEDADGLLELAGDAPVGEDLREWARLDDTVIELELTPNRGDCLSIRGLAREVAVACGLPLDGPVIEPVPAASEDRFPVVLDAPALAPRYAGRVVRGIDPAARTPDWLAGRLLHAGVRPLHPVVDVTNYVMLELGQPMHAFDLARLKGGIRVRLATGDESLRLLDGRDVEPDAETLVIADDSGAIALAGIMGGEATAVGDRTTDIFLEAACFLPHAMAGRARRYGAHTDSSHRFERGVDPELAPLALERATGLILDICGGVPGPACDTVDESSLPARQPIRLRQDRLRRLLGHAPDAADVTTLLEGLGLSVEAGKEGWTAIPPSWRYDLAIEADLIEEVARIHGYQRTPRTLPAQPGEMPGRPEREQSPERLRDMLVERGYREAITYSFVDSGLLRRLEPDLAPLSLANPIASDMDAMRTTLWAGLITALQHNLNRQQQRVRLFEIGRRFVPDSDGNMREEEVLALLAAGPRQPDHWDGDDRPIDFFDVKGDLEALTGALAAGFRYEAGTHPALHPGQGARILADGAEAGWIGTLHPRLVADLELGTGPILAEVRLQPLRRKPLPAYRPVSRFPSIRRDLALIVHEDTPVQALVDGVREAGPEELESVTVFDVYRGKGVDSGRKSVALGLILQGLSRTLTDSEVQAAIERILDHLREHIGVTLRE